MASFTCTVRIPTQAGTPEDHSRTFPCGEDAASKKDCEKNHFEPCGEKFTSQAGFTEHLKSAHSKITPEINKIVAEKNKEFKPKIK